MLIPMALLIGIWGHERRVYAESIRPVHHGGLDLHADRHHLAVQRHGHIRPARDSSAAPRSSHRKVALSFHQRTEMLLFLASLSVCDQVRLPAAYWLRMRT